MRRLMSVRPFPKIDIFNSQLPALKPRSESMSWSTLVDLHSVSDASQIGYQQISERTSSLPGRSVQDLVVSQPGWLYEGNAVLHPRGSEYQTQFVVDGIPLTDNRSPSFGPEIEADDLESMSIYTAGFPAEYGRKMGGVVELNTRRQTDPGLAWRPGHVGRQLQYACGLRASAANSSSMIQLPYRRQGHILHHYLNPVVPAELHEHGNHRRFFSRL